ncbi:MAG: DUF1501 domain-containing protein [Acidobacteriota bacterium]
MKKPKSSELLLRARSAASYADYGLSRRELLRMGMHGVGVSAALPLLLHRTSAALAATTGGAALGPLGDKILVVVELSGGNDGLNTLVPHGNDDYYRQRPTIGLKKEELLLLDDEFGLHPSLKGLERLYKDGKMAAVHGCGYDNPSLSHFESMGFWHTGVPNAGEALGWLGRLADLGAESDGDPIVNIGSSQSPAVRGADHTPVVFSDPERFEWKGSERQRATFERLTSGDGDEAASSDGSLRNGEATDAEGRHLTNPSLDFLHRVSANAAQSSQFVRIACADYKTPVDYGIRAGLGGDLIRVAALIAARMPTNLYYVSAAGNQFDTHVHQADVHSRLLMYTSDALHGFMEDLERIGRADDVAVLVFTEFGRRVEENASLGTDHGTATPLFVLGKGVKGGLHGKPPSLTELDDGNLIKTTDFRQVYASVVEEWLGFGETEALLKASFDPLGLFAGKG